MDCLQQPVTIPSLPVRPLGPLYRLFCCFLSIRRNHIHSLAPFHDLSHVTSIANAVSRLGS